MNFSVCKMYVAAAILGMTGATAAFTGAPYPLRICPRRWTGARLAAIVPFQ